MVMQSDTTQLQGEQIQERNVSSTYELDPAKGAFAEHGQLLEVFEAQAARTSDRLSRKVLALPDLLVNDVLQSGSPAGRGSHCQVGSPRAHAHGGGSGREKGSRGQCCTNLQVFAEDVSKLGHAQPHQHAVRLCSHLCAWG